MLLWISEAGEMDVKQLYGRNDMVMLEQHNKIYGSLGIAEQTILKTAEGNPAVLENPRSGVAENVITDFKMQGWTEQDGTPTPEAPVPIVSAGTQNQDAGEYDYEVKLTGANLWDATKAADKSNWVASTTQKGYSDFAIDVVPGQKITFSFPEKLPLGIPIYVGIVSIEDGNIGKWLYHSTSEYLIVQQATITAITDKIWVRCNSGGIKIFVQDNPYFQIEYGSKRTDFQPYREQTLTLTSDRPLTKWDKLEKRNGQWGWVYKSAEIESYTDESVPGEYFSTTGQLSTGAQVWYETTTETFVPLSESEQEAMSALEMYLPTTVITNNVDCNMIVTYKSTQNGGESE